MLNKIKEFMSNQTEDHSIKKSKKKKEEENGSAVLLQEIETLKSELEESKDKY